ncbi:MAG: FMN-binding negative transcriptional regulator [Methylophilus sp.]|uniref:FMN-binding negative transcriptional regulator n=1 Tax=Methylophilus sp. TaxID=29541 RepID=UPI003FA159C4
MYIPKHFSETDTDALHETVRAYPLATLVSTSSNSINANHLPLHFAQKKDALGSLIGHVARANPLCKEIMDGQEVLAIFHGPHAYISPSWYATKARAGMVVPTWNYVVVHAHGTFKLMDDAQWLRAHLETLTADHESRFEKPWRLDDAPAAFIDKLIDAVVGIEIEITHLTGKCKASQNQAVENQLGVLQGLRARDQQQDHAMASVIARVNHL